MYTLKNIQLFAALFSMIDIVKIVYIFMVYNVMS